MAVGKEVIKLIGLLPRGEAQPFAVVVGQDSGSGDIYVAEFGRDFKPGDAPVIVWHKVETQVVDYYQA